MPDHPSHGTAGPKVSFGSYVRPETVQETPELQPYALPFITAQRQPGMGRPMPQARQAVDPMLIGAGFLTVLTFLLGVMVSLYVAEDRGAAMAQVPLAPQPQPQLEDVAAVVEPAENDTMAEPAATSQAAAPQALARIVSASLEGGVTRDVPSDLITPVGAMSQASTGALSMTEILLGLTPQRAPALGAGTQQQDILNRDKLHSLRESVLAGAYTVKTVVRNGQERLCLRVFKDNVSQDEAADMLQQAAERGDIVLPPSINTADGTFDADTLIFNLVQTSLANDGTEAGRLAAEEMGRRAAEASRAKSERVSGLRVYLVEPGDSLAYISLQFYGKPKDYLRIFEANRNILTSPDEIQIGQRLIIPS